MGSLHCECCGGLSRHEVGCPAARVISTPWSKKTLIDKLADLQQAALGTTPPRPVFATKPPAGPSVEQLREDLRVVCFALGAVREQRVSFELKEGEYGTWWLHLFYGPKPSEYVGYHTPTAALAAQLGHRLLAHILANVAGPLLAAKSDLRTRDAVNAAASALALAFERAGGDWRKVG
jgi:hypothetical protein